MTVKDQILTLLSAEGPKSTNELSKHYPNHKYEAFKVNVRKLMHSGVIEHSGFSVTKSTRSKYSVKARAYGLVSK
jgi:predicted transcriptional regulator